MPSSHLACDGSTEPVSCPYPPFRAASARPPCGGRRRLWDFRIDSRAPRRLRFGFNSEKFYKFEKNLSVEHLHTIASHILHNTNSHMFNHNSSCYMYMYMYVRNEPAIVCKCSTERWVHTIVWLILGDWWLTDEVTKVKVGQGDSRGFFWKRGLAGNNKLLQKILKNIEWHIFWSNSEEVCDVHVYKYRSTKANMHFELSKPLIIGSCFCEYSCQSTFNSIHLHSNNMPTCM